MSHHHEIPTASIPPHRSDHDEPGVDHPPSLNGSSATTTPARVGASWSGRNSFRLSSALSPAPVGEGEVRRRAPDRLGGAERGLTQNDSQPPNGTFGPSCGHQPPDEPPSWREPDDPPLLAPLYRKRTKETRSRARSIRFTPTAERVIEAAAQARGQFFAGYVGDVAYAHALGKTGTSSPEDDPVRPLVETVERLIAQLRRTGNNLNQVTHAINSGVIPDRAEHVLVRVEEAVEDAFTILDGFVGKEAA